MLPPRLWRGAQGWRWRGGGGGSRCSGRGELFSPSRQAVFRVSFVMCVKKLDTCSTSLFQARSPRSRSICVGVPSSLLGYVPLGSAVPSEEDWVMLQLSDMVFTASSSLDASDETFFPLGGSSPS